MRTRLLASTDFALRVLLKLGEDPARQLSTEALSAGIGVPRNHAQKIAKDLSAAGLVRTRRGARGVMLARPSDEIRIGAILRRLEAGHAPVECFRADGGACCFSPACRLEPFPFALAHCNVSRPLFSRAPSPDQMSPSDRDLL